MPKFRKNAISREKVAPQTPCGTCKPAATAPHLPPARCKHDACATPPSDENELASSFFPRNPVFRKFGHASPSVVAFFCPLSAPLVCFRGVAVRCLFIGVVFLPLLCVACVGAARPRALAHFLSLEILLLRRVVVVFQPSVGWAIPRCCNIKFGIVFAGGFWGQL